MTATDTSPASANSTTSTNSANFRDTYRPHLSAAAGAVLAPAVGIAALLAGYPGPITGAEWLTFVTRAAGLVIIGAFCGWLWTHHRLRSPAIAVGAGTLIAIALELATSSAGSHVMIDGIRLNSGPPILAAFSAAWPVFLAATVVLAVGEARIRHLGRPTWRASFAFSGTIGIVAAAATTAVAATQPATLAAGGLPFGTLIWGFLGLFAAFTLCGLLLARPAVVTPIALLTTFLILLSTYAGIADIGAPATLFLTAWPGYLLASLLLSTPELLIRLITKIVRHRRRERRTERT